MEIFSIALLCVAAMLAGMVNSVAGGGTLLTFPALIWVLGSDASAMVVANATSTIALFPGSLASMWGYRSELQGMRNWIAPLLLPSLLGAALGTGLVAQRNPQEFQSLVPWLILTATTLFLLQPSITRWTGIGSSHEVPGWKTQLMIIGFQFFIAIYGGYFGAGIGILMLSALSLMGVPDIHRMNAIKTLLASTINGVSVLIFLGYGKVQWNYATPMIFAAIAGGYFGALLAKRLDRNLVRYSVIVIGMTLAAYYFLRTLQA